MREIDSFLRGMNASFVEGLFAQYSKNPQSVPPMWQDYFDELTGHTTPRSVGSSTAEPPLSASPQQPQPHAQASAAAVLQDRVDQLIRAYRVRGHLIAEIDPLGLPRDEPEELDPRFYGLTEADLDASVSARTIAGPRTMTVRQVLHRMRRTYCRSIGVQFMHIDELQVKNWLQERMESTENDLELSREEQLRILSLLTDAVSFEQFIQRKYPGAKSFSLEGAETLIPLLATAIEDSGARGVDEIVIGMAHRGRLNVLSNIMGKTPEEIFSEFEDVDPRLLLGCGDVKYHLGHSSDWTTSAGRKIHLSLCFNPSHLEFVNSVVMGRVRAKQTRFGDTERKRCLALMIHGDASFAGEGVIQETLNMSQLDGYSVGGAVHVIVNNQIGFTTPPGEGRSSTYATDVAKMLQSPIFHVNGEYPEAVAQVVQLALSFRHEFKRDVVIDMYCYRRRGHNEGDEPAFTQPVMYRAIRERGTVRESYLDHLCALGSVSIEEAEAIVNNRRHQLEEELARARSQESSERPRNWLRGVWDGFAGGHEADVPEVDTGISAQRLESLFTHLTQLPEHVHPHRKLVRVLESRAAMGKGEKPIPWAEAELLAFGSLLQEGAPVRLSGQDVGRGTFSQRHIVVHDNESGEAYIPLQHLGENQAQLDVHNSPLSEVGVLGFEYGYSLDSPEALVVWEAQFGDFCNVAQVIIDQFLVSAEDKWRRLSGVVLLLPHGFEGMGPEHSSARLERFLTLAAEDNIQVVQPTTPAQHFHVLRRQVKRSWRKPLVVMTPKSLLRHHDVVSTGEEFEKGTFQRVLKDAPEFRGDHIRRICLCSGKVYYDLLARRREKQVGQIAILRLEQLYPMPLEHLKEALEAYEAETPIVWVQEEPENMGAWRNVRHVLSDRPFDRHPLTGITRAESASPATGSQSSHAFEQDLLVSEALGLT